MAYLEHGVIVKEQILNQVCSRYVGNLHHLWNYNGEYGSLGLNMAYERKNDGTQIYNYDPNML